MSFQELFQLQYLSGQQWLAMLPLVCMSLSAIGALMLAPLRQSGRLLGFTMLCAGTLGALASILAFPSHETITVLDGVLVFDRMSQVFSAIVVLSGLAAALMTLGFDEREGLQAEFFALIAFASVGGLAMVSTQNLVFFFIALELLSLAVYVLVSMYRHSPFAAEAGLKYFLLGGAASAIMLYGASFLYGTTGTLDVSVMRTVFDSQWQGRMPGLAMVGLGLFVIGLFFKIGAFPFHVWVPDVYTGAVTPVSGFMISGVKAAATGALLRMSLELLALPAASQPVLVWILGAVIAFTQLFGAFVGLRQNRIKRMFAYSTIIHTGYVLLGFLAILGGGSGAESAPAAIVSYTLFYVVMNLGSFAVLTLISPKDSDDITLDTLTGLGQRKPYLAFALSIFLLSMAGIPPTAGFFGKYYLFSAALASGYTGIAILSAVVSLISAVIYLRPMYYMYMKESDASFQTNPAQWFGSSAVIALSLFLTIVMGLIPAWFSRLL